MSSETRTIAPPTTSTRALRERVLADPDVILEDGEVMRALVGANETRMGANIVDLRGAAMARLEERLDRLESTHRTVVAAAYDNVAGTEQIHRAVLAVLEPITFEEFLLGLGGEVADILRVDCVKLVLEERPDVRSARLASEAMERFAGVLTVLEAGGVADYLARDGGRASRPVILRGADDEARRVFGAAPGPLGSEALLQLSLGAAGAPAMLALGTRDAQQFQPGQGTDLLAFLGGVIQRALGRWLT